MLRSLACPIPYSQSPQSSLGEASVTWCFPRPIRRWVQGSPLHSKGSGWTGNSGSNVRDCRPVWGCSKALQPGLGCGRLLCGTALAFLGTLLRERIGRRGSALSFDDIQSGVSSHSRWGRVLPLTPTPSFLLAASGSQRYQKVESSGKELTFPGPG